MSTIKIGEYEIPVQPIPADWSDLNDEDLEKLLTACYGSFNKIVSVEDGKESVSWVIPVARNSRHQT